MSHFPNLARGFDASQEDITEVSDICKAELEAAGLETHTFGDYYGEGEVPSKTMGFIGQWKFERAWYYWRADGPGIPPEIAEQLHAGHGKDVRVAGHCGCPSPLEWYGGFAVGDYHVNTPEGLKALADCLRGIIEANKPVAE